MTNLFESSERLSRDFYNRPTEIVAQDLIGKALVRWIDGAMLGGIIVETEAYLPEGDLASHSSRGKTRSNAAMFGPPGLLYVYPIHAKYCLNAVTQATGEGAAVLIRAIKPVWGIDQMKSHRRQSELNKLTRGPAMLCQALDVTRSLDGIDLTQDQRIGIFHHLSDSSTRIVSDRRVGISKSEHLSLRFLDGDSRYVSRRCRT
ncbi:DNA-3-methyladenine glycosylase [Rubripirellula amarantea]|uniref:DNA-3-methyladenine glycosylase n=1 Tax=Rubripirellula amarantea TaxID=2527999 RepID=UPI0011B6527B|nr:DNA-3-methyladenine glycosylase [Rubripirellula amarantea]